MYLLCYLVITPTTLTRYEVREAQEVWLPLANARGETVGQVHVLPLPIALPLPLPLALALPLTSTRSSWAACPYPPPPPTPAPKQAILVICTILIFLVMFFEWLRHSLQKNIPHMMSHIVTALFGELTVLGFIAVFTFFLVASGFMHYMSSLIYHKSDHLIELFEEVHFDHP